MTTADPIGEYAATLARALYGPRRTRRSMVAEARAGLHDAAAAYRTGGAEPEQAAAQAVRDFGTVAEVAPEFQDELTARQGRWAAVMVAIVFPAMLVAWDLMSGSGALRRDAMPPREIVVVLARIEDVMAVVVASVAVALLAVTFRRTIRPRRLTRAIGLTGTAGALICGGLPVAMFVAGGRSGVVSPPEALAYFGSAVVLSLVVWQSVRTLHAARAAQD